MLRILACLMTPLIVLFAGLIPGYSWAIPLCIGSVIIFVILIGVDYNEREVLNEGL